MIFCSLILEHLISLLIRVFSADKKSKYVKVLCGTVDARYASTSQEELLFKINNRLLRLYKKGDA